MDGKPGQGSVVEDVHLRFFPLFWHSIQDQRPFNRHLARMALHATGVSCLTSLQALQRLMLLTEDFIKTVLLGHIGSYNTNSAGTGSRRAGGGHVGCPMGGGGGEHRLMSPLIDEFPKLTQ